MCEWQPSPHCLSCSILSLEGVEDRSAWVNLKWQTHLEKQKTALEIEHSEKMFTFYSKN